MIIRDFHNMWNPPQLGYNSARRAIPRLPQLLHQGRGQRFNGDIKFQFRSTKHCLTRVVRHPTWSCYCFQGCGSKISTNPNITNCKSKRGVVRIQRGVVAQCEFIYPNKGWHSTSWIIVMRLVALVCFPLSYHCFVLCFPPHAHKTAIDPSFSKV